jgi:tRNA pseudouridine(55) synthase
MAVFVVDKPLGLTSHDVVHRARRARGTRRVGHTGTLDPLATGVLVLCVDDATKLVQFMEADSKDYLAWISLGAGTPTLDAEGPVEERADAPLPAPDEVEPCWRDSWDRSGRCRRSTAPCRSEGSGRTPWRGPGAAWTCPPET